MPNIFNYVNYRAYLRAFYAEKKEKSADFSYETMAAKAGFSSKSFLKLVIDGKKNLTEASVQQVNKVLNLKGKSFSYFCDLVAFNQARSIEERDRLLQRLFSYRRRNPGRLVLQKQYAFYAQWYHNTIRELVCSGAFTGNFRALGRMLRPPISARQARQSVRLLLTLGFIRKEGERYVQTSPLITTGDEVLSAAVRKFHTQNLALAGQAMDTCSADERDISCLVLGLSRDGVARVKEETQAFRKKILAIAAQDKDPDRVYHYNVQFFPTSERPGGAS